MQHRFIPDIQALSPDPQLFARKVSLRAQLRSARKKIPPAQRRRESLDSARAALSLRAVQRARHIAVYWAVGSELSTRPLIKRLQALRCTVYLPVVNQLGQMRFLPLPRNFTPGRHLRRDALGLPRSQRSRPQRTLRRCQLAFLPLVGFSLDGRRLGAGGGYYDRALANREPLRLPRLIGYAHPAQRSEHIPSEAFDVNLDEVIAGKHHIRCRNV